MSDTVIYVLGGLMFFQAIIWLVPFLGAAMALAGLQTDKDTTL